MRLLYGIALVIMFAPAVVDAQATTADGVQALVRGDYEAAARILKPLAEDVPRPDPIAQFFLASLYNSGHGVTRNPFRACGLYASVGSTTNPLTQQALDIAQTLRPPMAGPMADSLCAPAHLQPWREAPPASFTLGPGHWLRLDAASTTIGFEGAERRTAASRSGAGIVYLPIQYTPLDVSQPVAFRRHFIQSFIWHRNGSDLSTWSLGWLLEEVVGADLVMVTGDPRLMTTTASQAPAVETSRLVSVRVTAMGEAEWVITDAGNARGGIIPVKRAR